MLNQKVPTFVGVICYLQQVTLICHDNQLRSKEVWAMNNRVIAVVLCVALGTVNLPLASESPDYNPEYRLTSGKSTAVEARTIVPMVRYCHLYDRLMRRC